MNLLDERAALMGVRCQLLGVGGIEGSLAHDRFGLVPHPGAARPQLGGHGGVFLRGCGHFRHGSRQVGAGSLQFTYRCYGAGQGIVRPPGSLYDLGQAGPCPGHGGHSALHLPVGLHHGSGDGVGSCANLTGECVDLSGGPCRAFRELSHLLGHHGEPPPVLTGPGRLKWLMTEGRLRPGMPLPSVRVLAQTLGLNRNTVNAVYDELRAEGLISMGRGRGARVAHSERVRHLSRLKELYGLMSRSYRQAEERGFGPAEIARAAQLSAQLLLARPEGADTVTFVECAGHDRDFYLQHMVSLINQPVQFMELSEFRQDPLRAGRLVVTTLMHAREVRRLVSPDVSLVLVGASLLLETERPRSTC